MPDELDDRLRAYLDEQESGQNSNKAVMGALSRIDDNVLDLAARFQTHELRDEERHSEVKKLLNGHDNRIDELEHDEVTGQHNLATLRTKVEEHEKWRAWWRENLWKVALGVVQALVIAVVTWVVSRAVYGRP